jgi:serine/threonine-protein phosphatase 2A regulatory subunit A
MPSFEKLSKDPSQYVRLSLVQAICNTSGHIEVETAVQKLLPIINTLIKDESFDVRISFADSMHQFNKSIGPDKVLSYSIPLVLQLMKDNQWRLRLKVVECLPQVAEMIGSDSFNENISEPLINWIKDSVFAVREATLESIKQIASMDGYGEVWVKTRVLPVIQELAKDQVFTRRMTCLNALNKFGSLVGAKDFFALVELLGNDPVPNIKFNVSKTIKNNFNKVKGQSYNKILEKMKGDSDPDVKFFAEDALREVNKKN